MATERVQKILAQAGIASRRQSETLIRMGEVTINGKIAKLGDKADISKDSIKVNGKLLTRVENTVYFAFHKPKGVISALSDPEGRATLGEFLKLRHIQTRIYPVGRLDFNSEGLIIMTNDGDLAEQLQKSRKLVRVYRVKVRGHPDQRSIERLRRGMRDGRKVVRPKAVWFSKELSTKSFIDIALEGGSSVDVKDYFEKKGIQVDRIVRTSIGHLTLTGIEPGYFKSLKQSQVIALVEQPELGERLMSKAEEEGREADIRRRAAAERAAGRLGDPNAKAPPLPKPLR
ncbi:MAG: pseudouridine synthase [Bdellovibrionota bacterium]